MLIALLLALQSFPPDPEITELPGVTVVARPLDFRLRVQVSGATAPADLVVSADPAMYCGDPQFNYSPGPHRQCWLRGRRGAPIVLTAQHDGEFGRDWTVAWTGCEPQADGRSCAVPISGEMEVGAAFQSRG